MSSKAERRSTIALLRALAVADRIRPAVRAAIGRLLEKERFVRSDDLTFVVLSVLKSDLEGVSPGQPIRAIEQAIHFADRDARLG